MDPRPHIRDAKPGDRVRPPEGQPDFDEILIASFPERGGPREGSTEWHFAKGAAAFRAGEPRRTTEDFDWLCGWDSALASKRIAFQEYVKQKKLHRQQFYADKFRDNGLSLEELQAIRQRRMVRLEEEYPDFPEFYMSLLKDMRSVKG